MAGNKMSILTCGHCGNTTAFTVAAQGFRPTTIDANDTETTTWSEVPVYASENRFILCISPSSLSPFSVHVSMECRFSDRGDLVAEATASFHHIHP